MNKNQLGFGALGLFALIIIFVLSGAVGWLVYDRQKSAKIAAPAETIKQSKPVEDTKKSEVRQSFTEIKSDHFIVSEPKNNENWSTGVKGITIGFDLPIIVETSKIKILKDGTDVTVGTARASMASYTLRENEKVKSGLAIDSKDSSPGNYQVHYTACFIDNTCSEGAFGYSIGL